MLQHPDHRVRGSWEPYWEFTTGRRVTIPDSANLSITGDMTVEVHVALDDYTGVADQVLASKYGGSGQRSWYLRVSTTGLPVFHWTSDGAADLSLFAGVTLPSVGIVDGQKIGLRVSFDVNNGASGRTAQFFYSTNDGVSWVQLGADVTTGTATSIFDSTTTVEWGSRTTGVAPMMGKFYRGFIYSGLLGTGVVRCSVDAGLAIDESATFIDGEGNVCTVVGTPPRVNGPAIFAFNASHPGAAITYSTDGTRFGLQTALMSNIALISFSHNDGATHLTYGVTYVGLINQWRAKYPQALIVPVAQNPRKSPGSNVGEHAMRCRSVISLAEAYGMPCINAYQAFLDTGAPSDYVDDGDGVHPTAAGFQLWRDEAERVLVALAT